MARASLRDTVLDAAVAHIAAHGPDGLSFRQIATDAGVSHQAPYHHFADRQAIFQAIAVEGFTRLLDAMDTVPPASGADVTDALVERYVTFALANRGHFRVMFRPDLTCVSGSPELQRVGGAAFDAFLAHVERLLGPDTAAERVQARATGIWALAHGLAVLLVDGSLESRIGTVDDIGHLIRSLGAFDR